VAAKFLLRQRILFSPELGNFLKRNFNFLAKKSRLEIEDSPIPMKTIKIRGNFCYFCFKAKVKMRQKNYYIFCGVLTKKY